jgi:predicted RND superfamily exporter protein
VKVNTISEKIIAFKWPIIVLVSVLTILFGLQIRNLKIDADVLSSLPDSDPNALLMRQIGQNFGGNRMGIVILETDNIYRTEVIQHIGILTDTIERIDGISSVSSLSNIINIKGGDAGIEIGQLVDQYDLPDSKEDFDLLRDNIEANAMYKGSIVSEDETSCLIVFTLRDDANVNLVAQQVIDKTTALELPEKLYYIGSPMLITYIAQLMKKDLTALLPIALILIAIILFISFRTWNGVMLPLITAVISIVWTLGLMALMGFSMSMISNNIPMILLAVGSAYAIHVVNRIQLLRNQGNPFPVKAAMNYVMVPVILAAVTTAIGFVSFIFGAYLEMIKEFGIFTAAGTFVACLLSIFFVPAVLEVSGRKPKADGDATGSKDDSLQTKAWSDRFLIPLKSFLMRHPRQILTAWGLVILASLFGIFFITRSVDIQDYFKKGNPTRQAERIMVEKFGGTKPVFVHFKGNMQDPMVLNTMMRASAYMEESPDIYTSMSVAKLIAEINLAITGNREVPAEADMIQQLWFLLDGNEVMQRFVNENLTEGIIISKFRSPDNKSKKEFASYMQKFIEANSQEECQIKITGMPFVDITMDQSLVNSQIGSISIAIVFVILIVGLILRSLKSGVYAALPIIAAILILFGLMGLTGISLNMATVLVASVALGIGIDYSIHVISHFNQAYEYTGDLDHAIEEAVIVSGRAIVINVISVSAGFLVLVFSEMVPLQYFGILIAISMFSSSFGALTMLPAILILSKKKHDPLQKEIKEKS